MREFTTLLDPRARLLERLLTIGLVQKAPPKLEQPGSRFYKADQICAYHSGGAGHSTEDCINLKHKIQDLIEKREIVMETATPNVNTNPLLNHENGGVHMIERDEDWEACGMLFPRITKPLEQTVASLTLQEQPKFKVLIPSPGIPKVMPIFRILVQAPAVAQVAQQIAPDLKKPITAQASMTQGMTRSGKCFTPEELAQNATRKENVQKSVITEGEAKYFWWHMQSKYYSIVEYLKKTPAQISVLSLLASSQSHTHALMKVLDDTHVPAGMISEDIAGLVAHIIGEREMCFSKEELHIEGTSHNKALYITLECRDKAVGRVLVDNGSGLNICPTTTLTQLGHDIGKIHQSAMNFRGFDGSLSDSLGKVDLQIRVGPASFTAEFQVMAITANYNMLLGRPWIHSAGAVPSSLHQAIKFEWEGREIVAAAKRDTQMHPYNTFPMIVGDPHFSNFHLVEYVGATHAEEEVDRLMLAAYKMIASTMLRNDFETRKGLGRDLEGITEPVPIPKENYHFSLEYTLNED
ncbi:uncharacterized protein LOC132637477 [Lycium barbarum]|uniref:uncharacterized protein LOC132637477 n=1 Tax=Lycium barbarum TaxID=112863 RepID=UPI00293E7B13|nr:uncharacterized protein LOC132637477 [Lycium barbarum]